MAYTLKTRGSPIVTASLPNKRRRYDLFDSVLLNVLAEGRDQGKRVFTDLFSRNPPQRVLKFLDEDTTLVEDLQIMRSVNIPAFLLATADALRRRVFVHE
jgi:lycopene beta-cyclase